MRIFIFLLLFGFMSSSPPVPTYRVGAKNFNEGYILGELLAQLLENEGYQVERVFNLGGTVVCYEALQKEEIDVYPEYTGSLVEEILKSKNPLTEKQLNERLQRELSLEVSPAFGFNNTYTLVTTPAIAKTYHLATISDLATVTELPVAFSHEFLERQDGWPSLKKAYRLKLDPSGITHGLAYQAITHDKIKLTDAYSTDGELEKYDLTALKDDLNFFPDYKAIALFRSSLNKNAKKVFTKLSNSITEEEMRAMNADVLFNQKEFGEVAQSFLLSKKLIEPNTKKINHFFWLEIGKKLLTHMKITASAVGLAILCALLLGTLLYLFTPLAKPVLYLAGLLQTIPSIALLALMIPFMGIGYKPAIIALFLYALLPILRNLVTGLNAVDPVLKKVATGMGMTRFQKLNYVVFPLAMPAILAGIRTATVITIGTATLAAFIGAGGLGEFIVTGLALNNTNLILQGAIPAALLAVIIEFTFEAIERRLIPKHLQN